MKLVNHSMHLFYVLDIFFDRWIELSKAEKTWEGLQDLLLREQILSTCSKELSVFLREKACKDVKSLCDAAELWQEAHPNKSVAAKKSDLTLFPAAFSLSQPTPERNQSTGNRLQNFRPFNRRRYDQNGPSAQNSEVH